MKQMFAIALALFLLLLGGCAKPPAPKVFYPPAPDAPRIQYLVSYSSELDLKKGTFSRVLNEQAGNLGIAIERGHSVGFYDNKMYVIDSRQNTIILFDLVKEKARILDEASKAFHKPMQIVIDREGTKFISDPNGHQIIALDRNDQPVKSYRKPKGFIPYGLAVDDKYLYATEIQKSKLFIIDKASGEVARTLTADNGLSWPSDVDLDAEGNLLTTNLANFKIIRLSPEGALLNDFGNAGDTVGSFARPKGLASDREDRTFVLDTAFENVQIFDRNSRMLMVFGNGGPRPEDMVMPSSIMIDYSTVDYFQQFAAPGFKLEYIIAIANQRGPSKINIYGFGRMEDADYSAYDE